MGITTQQGPGDNTTPHTMALPKSMRILAVATVGIFFYLCLLILQAPATIEPPTAGSGQKLDKMIKDPNLDRMSTFYHKILYTNEWK